MWACWWCRIKYRKHRNLNPGVPPVLFRVLYTMLALVLIPMLTTIIS